MLQRVFFTFNQSEDAPRICAAGACRGREVGL